jgi:hypothetical protein
VIASLPPVLRPIAITLACVLLFALTLVLLSRGDRRSPALLRLDWFLPQLRRLKGGQLRNNRWMGRILSHCLPSSWQSDHHKKKRGRVTSPTGFARHLFCHVFDSLFLCLLAVQRSADCPSDRVQQLAVCWVGSKFGRN